MSNEEFISELVKLSKKIATLLAGRNGTRVSTELGSLAQAFTSTADPASALKNLQSNLSTLAAFEDVVATAVRAASPLSHWADLTATNKQVIPLISLAVLVGFFALLGVLVTKTNWGTVEKIQNVLFTLLGALSAAFTQVVNYWLGSSKGSADKTNLLASPQSGS